MTPGALQGDPYCQILLNIDMGDCDGCPDYQRRIEVYSNNVRGCGLEFYVEPEVPPKEEEEEKEPEEKPEEVEEKPDDGGNTGGSGGGSTTTTTETTGATTTQVALSSLVASMLLFQY